MTAFPTLSMARRLARLEPPAGRVRAVLDTDTYNEIDDQFALVYALLAPERIDLEAIYAAPFRNERAATPAEGMEKSYAEILRLLDRLGRSPEGLVHRGSRAFLSSDREPVRSDAALDLVGRARATPADEPLFVLAIGAITDVASALLIDPAIIDRIVVVWLGGHALHWPHTREFNLEQDIHAARLIFDSGVPLVHIPCMGVTSHLLTTVAEIERYVQGRGAIGDYLAQIFAAYEADHSGWSKVIWDIAAVAYLVKPAWLDTCLAHSPVLTDQLTWSADPARHFIRYTRYIQRDPIFRDLFARLEARSRQ